MVFLSDIRDFILSVCGREFSLLHPRCQSLQILSCKKNIPQFDRCMNYFAVFLMCAFSGIVIIYSELLGENVLLHVV